ncbi:hypothetical protein AB4305_03765 [Nocardia sp. 2YAB30]|uniref:hypothetical protein n=1 Tax=unclassified Nocardia TaxID=2637762 RepID=UPI003F9CD0B7
MNDVDFTVTHVWDFQDRGGLLVTGRLAAGDITVGDVLYDSANSATVRVIGVEFHGGRHPGEYTLVVDRRDTDHVRIGQLLVSQPAHTATDPEKP